MPWPSRMFLVRCDAAPRKTSGDRRVGVLLQEVVLDLPGVVVAEPVGQLHLRERVLIELAFVVRPPWARKLQLVEDAELHVACPDLLASIPPDEAWGVKASPQA